MQQRKRYSEEFKREAVGLTRSPGANVSQIARDLGIRANQLHRWRRDLEADGKKAFPGNGVNALVNVLPLVVLALGTQWALARFVMSRAPLRQAACHGVLACLFSAGWYSAVVIDHALLRLAEGQSFELIGFSGPAVSWQTFQGLCLYSTVAAISYALRAPGERAALVPVERYLVRVGDDLVPVRADDIVCLQGAHDYVQLTTPRGRHLVRQTLADFGARLDPQRFIRVHRSALVNLDHVLRIEPIGGGRMRAILTDGSAVAASRAGTQLLRGFIV